MQAGHRHTDQLPQVLSTGGTGATTTLSQENVFNDAAGDQLTDPEILMNGFGETFYHFYEFYQFYGFYGFYMEVSPHLLSMACSASHPHLHNQTLTAPLFAGALGNARLAYGPRQGFLLLRCLL
jgi:hypothetical protein